MMCLPAGLRGQRTDEEVTECRPGVGAAAFAWPSKLRMKTSSYAVHPTLLTARSAIGSLANSEVTVPDSAALAAAAWPRACGLGARNGGRAPPRHEVRSGRGEGTLLSCAPRRAALRTRPCRPAPEAGRGRTGSPGRHARWSTG